MSDAKGESKRTGQHGRRITFLANEDHSPNSSQRRTGGTQFSPENPWRATIEEQLGGII